MTTTTPAGEKCEPFKLPVRAVNTGAPKIRIEDADGITFAYVYYCNDDYGKQIKDTLAVARVEAIVAAINGTGRLPASEAKCDGKISARVALQVLKAQAALVLDDLSEARHQLYAIASPNFDKLEPWVELEQIAGATLNDLVDAHFAVNQKIAAPSATNSGEKVSGERLAEIERYAKLALNGSMIPQRIVRYAWEEIERLRASPPREGEAPWPDIAIMLRCVLDHNERPRPGVVLVSEQTLADAMNAIRSLAALSRSSEQTSTPAMLRCMEPHLGDKCEECGWTAPVVGETKTGAGE